MDRTELRQRAQVLISSGEDIEMGQAILDLLAVLEGQASACLDADGRPVLTGRQRLVLEHLRDFKLEHGCSPTLRELKASLGISSTNGVNDHLKALERKGYVVRTFGLARSVRLRASDGTLF